MVPHIFVLRIPGLKDRDGLRLKLENLGVSTGVHYKPNHLLKFYKTSYKLPTTEAVYPEILTLPLHTRLSQSDIDDICEVFDKTVDKFL
jgi:dTDP-4-amino-4,6-dideoxygalactose transaminase